MTITIYQNFSGIFLYNDRSFLIKLSKYKYKPTGKEMNTRGLYLNALYMSSFNNDENILVIPQPGQ